MNKPEQLYTLRYILPDFQTYSWQLAVESADSVCRTVRPRPGLLNKGTLTRAHEDVWGRI